MSGTESEQDPCGDSNRDFDNDIESELSRYVELPLAGRLGGSRFDHGRMFVSVILLERLTPQAIASSLIAHVSTRPRPISQYNQAEGPPIGIPIDSGTSITSIHNGGVVATSLVTMGPPMQMITSVYDGNSEPLGMFLLEQIVTDNRPQVAEIVTALQSAKQKSMGCAWLVVLCVSVFVVCAYCSQSPVQGVRIKMERLQEMAVWLAATAFDERSTVNENWTSARQEAKTTFESLDRVAQGEVRASLRCIPRGLTLVFEERLCAIAPEICKSVEDKHAVMAAIARYPVVELNITKYAQSLTQEVSVREAIDIDESWGVRIRKVRSGGLLTSETNKFRRLLAISLREYEARASEALIGIIGQ